MSTDLATIASRLGSSVFPAPETTPPPPSPPATSEQPWTRGPKKVSYTHDAMIDMLIMNPMISGGELAAYFGYTRTWVSQVINSAGFKARLEARKSELVDPMIIQNLDEKVLAAAQRSLDVVMEKLDSAPTPDFALKVAQTMLQAQGYGARDRGNGGPQVALIVNVPPKAESVSAWSAKYGNQVIEATPTEAKNG